MTPRVTARWKGQPDWAMPCSTAGTRASFITASTTRKAAARPERMRPVQRRTVARRDAGWRAVALARATAGCGWAMADMVASPGVDGEWWTAMRCAGGYHTDRSVCKDTKDTSSGPQRFEVVADGV